MNINSLFLERIRKHTERTAMVLITTSGKREYSWCDYFNQAVSTAKWLRNRGIKQGDFVAIIPLNLPESFFALMGIILAGGVPVPINIQLLKQAGLSDLKKIIDDCRPGLVLHNECLGAFVPQINTRPCTVEGAKEDWYGPLEPVLQIRASADNLLIMPYTSGTSEFKGVMLTHKNILDRVEAVSEEFKVTENERVLSYLPLGHIAELVTTFFGQIYNGYTVYFTEYAKDSLANRDRFRRNFPSVLKQVQPTIFVAVPKIWQSFRSEIEVKTENLPVIMGKTRPLWLTKLLVKKGLGFEKTRIFVSAAAELEEKERKFFANLGIPIRDIYGQTETAGPLLLDGQPIGKNCEVVLGENNEIVVSGPCVMNGYYRNQKENSRAFTRGKSGRTLYHTGDIGRIQEGRIFWNGRVGYGYKRNNGEYVDPSQVKSLESEIKKIDPRIAEVIIYGANKPHDVALIFIDNLAENLELQMKVCQVISGTGESALKVKTFQLVDSSELELTPTMKLKRNVMLKKFESTINALYSKEKER